MHLCIHIKALKQTLTGCLLPLHLQADKALYNPRQSPVLGGHGVVVSVPDLEEEEPADSATLQQLRQVPALRHLPFSLRANKVDSSEVRGSGALSA